MIDPKIQGVDYQHGQTYGYYDVRYFVFARDHYTCQVCGKSRDKILQTHHIRYRSNGGNYWYMNYYQECNQPKITAKNVRVFDTMDAYRKALDGKKFRCPSCGKESADPYNCKACGWAVYGLLGDLGKGVFVYVKEKLHGDNIFMPIAWEEED